MIIRTLGVLPDTLIDRLKQVGFSLVSIHDDSRAEQYTRSPVLVGTGADATLLRNQHDSALVVGLAVGEESEPAEIRKLVDVRVDGSDPDRLVLILNKLYRSGLDRHAEGEPFSAWMLVRENGSIASVSPALSRRMKQLGIKVPSFRLSAEDLQRLQNGEKISLDKEEAVANRISMRLEHMSGTEHEYLLAVVSPDADQSDSTTDNHPIVKSLPGIMLSGSLDACAGKLVDVAGSILPDRPVAVMIGPELTARAVRDMEKERARELAELLCNFNVRSILHEHAVPLSGEQVLVIPPAVALRLGSYPIESMDGLMPNLLVVQLRDPGDRLAGMIVGEIPPDRLPDPDQVRILQTVARFAAVAVRWQEVIAASADSVSLLESLIEYDPSGVAVLDDAGRIRKVNRSLQKLTGYRREELVGRTLNRIFMPDQVARIQDFRVQSTVGSFETEIPAASGDTRPVRVLVYPFRQHGTRHHVIQLEDLADNWALRQKELEVERLQAVFGAAVAFHDKINTPLSIILAHQERLKYKWKAGLNWEDLEKSLIAVEHQVDKITEIIERMRDMKRYRVREYALRNVSMLDLSDSTDGDSTET